MFCKLNPYMCYNCCINTNGILLWVKEGARKVIKRLVCSIILVILIFTGCSSNQTSKISTEAENTVIKVSKIYGEQNPKITVLETTQEETKKEPMYIVSLTGNFQKGEQKSRRLQFSITEDGKKVWALTSDSWEENEIPK
jgi:hypothetical protein